MPAWRSYIPVLSGAHMALLPRVVELLRENGMSDVLVIVGGIIPDEDKPSLKEAGVQGVFGPGTLTEDIVTFIRENVRKQGVGNRK
jgi:methylmalonyl-CoA mutase C-terminal domain/subunit